MAKSSWCHRVREKQYQKVEEKPPWQPICLFSLHFGLGKRIPWNVLAKVQSKSSGRGRTGARTSVSIHLLPPFYLKKIIFTNISQREFLPIPHPAITEQTGQHNASTVLMENRVVFSLQGKQFQQNALGQSQVVPVFLSSKNCALLLYIYGRKAPGRQHQDANLFPTIIYFSKQNLLHQRSILGPQATWFPAATVQGIGCEGPRPRPRQGPLAQGEVISEAGFGGNRKVYSSDKRFPCEMVGRQYPEGWLESIQCSRKISLTAHPDLPLSCPHCYSKGPKAVTESNSKKQSSKKKKKELRLRKSHLNKCVDFQLKF